VLSRRDPGRNAPGRADRTAEPIGIVSKVLRRLLARARLRRHRSGYHSRFGGLWTDRLDAEAELRRRLANGRTDPAEADQLRSWIRDGFVVLRGAVPAATCAAVRAEVEDIWANRDPDQVIEIGGLRTGIDPDRRSEHYKLLDQHARPGPARSALFAPRLVRFLESVLDQEPLLFQSLTFETGSDQPMHQDTAYVTVTRPMDLMAAWIALEDIQPGSGELIYYPGSHRLGDHVFRGGARNWNRERDGDAAHAAYLQGLHERAAALGLTKQSFLPRAGDVLVWSADLVHGGGPITRPELTRWSLVGHYCPADARPYYATYKASHRDIVHLDDGGLVASAYHRVADSRSPTTC
jgi:phytanoyl-CoA hydroxylase